MGEWGAKDLRQRIGSGDFLEEAGEGKKKG